jgi:hypothetical protein
MYGVRAVVAAASLFVSSVRPVFAQTAPPAPGPGKPDDVTVSLALAGPPGCGSESELAARVAWRTSRVRFVPVGASERHLDVALETGLGSAVATLTLSLPNGRRATRVLRAATCDEAVDAAALVAAVTLDPAATVTEGPPVTDTDAPAREPDAPAASAKPVPPSDRASDSRSENVASDASHSEVSGAVFVAGTLVSGPAPAPLYGIGLGAMVTWDRGSLISPAVRLTVSQFFGREFEDVGGTAYFSLLDLGADLCPLRIGDGGVALFVCGSFTAGALTAEGRETNDAQARTRSWLSLGGTLLLQARVVDWLEVDLFGVLAAPLLRDTFEFGCPPDALDCSPTLIHEVPVLSVRAGASLGVSFP